MKKYLLFIITLLFLSNVTIFSQAKLVQSFVETNISEESKFGWSVSTAGDVNNDGYDDVIIGAYGYNSATGRAYIYYGGSAMDNTPDILLDGEASNNSFGRSVSTAGDVNNDGYDDVIIGAVGYNSAYIYYGGSAMDNTPDVTMTGEAEDNYFGSSVSTAGDVNNDGYDDVIIGESGYNSWTGRAYIYSDPSAPVSVKETNLAVTEFNLLQNYPNPFNPSTTISYSIPHNGFVKITVYDITGQEVITLVNKEQAKGKYKITFDASGLNSGVYLYRIQSGGFTKSMKMILLK